MKQILALLLSSLFLQAADINWQPCNVSDGGHSLKIGFRSDITTNDASHWEMEKHRHEGYGFATNYAYWGWSGCVTNYAPPKFPITNINEQLLCVYSNTYALALCDGETNTLSESHVKIGYWQTKSVTVIVASTNTVSSESYTPK